MPADWKPELDAIVGHTAVATNEILDCCEVLERLQSEVPEAAAVVPTPG